MDIKKAIKSQYHASLAMFQQTVENCPAELWQREGDKNQFWHIAFHGLFYAHFYLHIKAEDFEPWPQHRHEIVSLEPEEDVSDVPAYTQPEILDYVEYFRARIDDMVDALDLAGPSGFYWLPFDKLELQFYNIRHLMLHTGEMSERLWAEAGIEGRWVGKRPE